MHSQMKTKRALIIHLLKLKIFLECPQKKDIKLKIKGLICLIYEFESLLIIWIQMGTDANLELLIGYYLFQSANKDK